MLFQISYYNGEESNHGLGYGIAPGNLSFSQEKIREKYKKYKVKQDKYLFRETIIEILDEPSILFENEGDLCLRLIGNSKRRIKKIAKGVFLPFEKNALVPVNLKKELITSNQ